LYITACVCSASTQSQSQQSSSAAAAQGEEGKQRRTREREDAGAGGSRREGWRRQREGEGGKPKQATVPEHTQMTHPCKVSVGERGEATVSSQGGAHSPLSRAGVSRAIITHGGRCAVRSCPSASPGSWQRACQRGRQVPNERRQRNNRSLNPTAPAPFRRHSLATHRLLCSTPHTHTPHHRPAAPSSGVCRGTLACWQAPASPP
jgi:hypothetical protein